MELRKIRTDRSAEVDGAWTEVVIFDQVAEMKVARAGNPEYDRCFERLIQPHRRALRSGKLPQEVRDQIEVECTADAILKDWRGLTNGGEPFPYTRENAITLLSEYPDVLQAVQYAALDAERFRLENLEESEGN